MASIDTRISKDNKKTYRVRVCKHGQTRTATFTQKLMQKHGLQKARAF